jgi:uncharacterized protein
MKGKKTVYFRFYEELNDFLAKHNRGKQFQYQIKYRQTVKDAIESLGVPHTEVDLILVNGESVDFDFVLSAEDIISVYPVFETLDISEVTKLRFDPLRVTRFILDVHLGKLCRYLRMLGFDSYYRNDLGDAEIVSRSVAENRIILTRDKGILKTRQVTHGYWLRSQNPAIQLREVVNRFSLKNTIKPFCRCIQCNGLLVKVEKEKIENMLEEKTRACYNTFFQCADCGKIYWRGTHFAHMNRFLTDLLKKHDSEKWDT